MTNHPLQHVIGLETVQEILQALTPDELVVATLRMEGCTDQQIAAMLGATRTHSQVGHRGRSWMAAGCATIAPTGG